MHQVTCRMHSYVEVVPSVVSKTQLSALPKCFVLIFFILFILIVRRNFNVTLGLIIRPFFKWLGFSILLLLSITVKFKETVPLGWYSTHGNYIQRRILQIHFLSLLNPTHQLRKLLLFPFQVIAKLKRNILLASINCKLVTKKEVLVMVILFGTYSIQFDSKLENQRFIDFCRLSPGCFLRFIRVIFKFCKDLADILLMCVLQERLIL